MVTSVGTYNGQVILGMSIYEALMNMVRCCLNEFQANHRVGKGSLVHALP